MDSSIEKILKDREDMTSPWSKETLSSLNMDQKEALIKRIESKKLEREFLEEVSNRSLISRPQYKHQLSEKDKKKRKKKRRAQKSSRKKNRK